MKMIAYLITGIVFSAVVSTCFYYYNKYNTTIRENELLEMANSSLQSDIEDQNKSIQNLQNQIAKIQELNKEIENVRIALRNDIELLQDKLNRTPENNQRTMEELSAAKPDYLETIINRATNDVFTELENITAN